MRKTYRRQRHSVSLLHAHLVFTTKYRRRVITPRVFEVLRKSMSATARAIGIDIVSLEADRDHLHIMICYPPMLSLSKIVQRLKGAASRQVRQQKFPDVLRKLWGKAFWSPSYFVVSCGGAPLEVVKAYVDGQNSQAHRSRRDRADQSRASNRKIKKAPYPRTEVRGLRARI